jgi:signal transduction histidine kinase/integral membrane sensor domain MASE1/CheY-like chemotaxis protein
MWTSSADVNRSAESAHRKHAVTFLVWLAIAAIGYFLLAVASVKLELAANGTQLVWFADGLALGLLVIAPLSMRLPVLLGTMIANVSCGLYLGAPAFAIAGGTVINLLQAFLAVYLLDLAKHRSADWGGLRSLSFFYLIACLGVNALCAFMHVFSTALNGAPFANTGFASAFWTLMIADGLGILLLTPLITISTEPWRDQYGALFWARRWELLVIIVGLLASSIWAYTRPPDQSGISPPYFYLGIPFLVWAALRFGRHAAIVSAFVYSLIAIYYTANSQGPFFQGRGGVNMGVEHLQEFLLVIVGLVHVLSATTRDRVAALRLKTDIERRYDAAILASGSLIFEIEPKTGAMQWAGDTDQVLGVGRAKITTLHDWTTHVHPEDRPALLSIREKLLSNEAPSVSFEYRVMRHPEAPGRPKPLAVMVGVNAFSYASTREDGSRERRIIGFMKDISEKHQAEADRKKLELELRQAQKMEAVGRLAGGIAHDFNNILASILGYGELARDKAADGSPTARHLDAILKAGERGRAMVSQILMFSRKSVAEASVVDLRALVEEVAELVRGSTRSAISLAFLQTDADIRVSGNATELHQLLMNLVTNGLQSMPEGSPIAISVEKVVLPAQLAIAQAIIGPGEFVRVDVTDTGTGINEETRERIFDPFFTTKATGKGTGLGLSLALSIAKAHEGGIDVVSHVNAGSTFSVYLPLTGDTLVATSTPTDARRGRGEQVMLVDDEAALLALGTEILIELGYAPVAFGRSPDALAAFEAAPNSWDLVLTDEVMPQLTGTELATRIHRDRAELPIIVITAYGGAGFELRAQEAGVIQVMRKPYQRRELAHALASALDSVPPK